MERVSVKSSNLVSVGYDPEKKILEIQFPGVNSVYQYSEVPEEVWADFQSSESKGKFFHKFVKGKFKTEKIKDGELAK